MIEDSGWLYLELPDIARIREEWGLPPVHDASKIEGALARPRQAFEGHTPYPDAPSKAGALGWGLSQAHGLIDGNKRLGAIATLNFLHVNGYDAAITEGELVAVFYECARGEMQQDEVSLFLRPRITLAPKPRQPTTGVKLHEMLQPHLDAIHLFTQQAGTEASVEGGDFWMVMEHVRALLDIAQQLDGGPGRRMLVSVLEDFAALSTKFRFYGADGDEQ